jgi:hypothetical protein
VILVRARYFMALFDVGTGDGGKRPMTTANEPVRIVALTASTAEVRLGAAPGIVSVGTVGSSRGGWFWRHRDGEQSSPVAANRSDAANELVRYHCAFKSQPARPRPVRRLLLG